MWDNFKNFNFDKTSNVSKTFNLNYSSSKVYKIKIQEILEIWNSPKSRMVSLKFNQVEYALDQKSIQIIESNFWKVQNLGTV